ncbi:MAG TPA: right-handed parallel beta-helix repeat-containing protein [Candidatus Polarisedimenticolia bacterium]|nr:right-handed parallel beta-helix repeat-containing protein [Candidatus Polarisedimenticolia bacterium]
MLLSLLLLAAFASVHHGAKPGSGAQDGVLTVKPGDSLAQIGQRLAQDAAIREVVLQAGTYDGEWVIPRLEKEDAAAHPLLIRAADGANVLFDGAKPLPKPKEVPGRPGVFSVAFETGGKREAAKLWEPEARVRYLLAADLDAVQRFPASFVVSGGTISFHTADGRAPRAGRVLVSVRDFGLEVRRPYVTVRGLRFRNFTARGKWSAAVNMAADHVTVDRCDAGNASFGFTLLSDDDTLLASTARDVGGGAYMAGRRGRVEGNRFLKTRDDFAVPAYPQDDSGIEAYYPAESGTIRGNLAIGFAQGIFIKSAETPWVVEGNTLVAANQQQGFIATQWHPESLFRRNVVSGYEAPMTFESASAGTGVAGNCDDPRFVDAGEGDYRLAPDSPCLAEAEKEKTPGEGDVGAGLVARSPERIDLRAGPQGDEPKTAGKRAVAAAGARGGADREPRTWQVSPTGRDGASGEAAAPLRSIQEAVDRAGPGDTILLQAGIYSEPVLFDHGGLEGKPITLRAAERWKAILDGARRHDDLIRIEKAPFVVIEDLEIRWYRQTGVRVSGAADVRVQGCRIWNAPWGGIWPQGVGVRVEESPRFTAAGNVVYRQERGFYLLSSPGATLTHNTALANLYGGVVFIHSIDGTTCTDNSFAYQVNDAISIVEGKEGKERLARFTCDYNNYGVTLQPGEPGEKPLEPRQKDRQLFTQSKAIVYFEQVPPPFQRFRTMAGWRKFSGLDAHSIFADPLFVDSAAGDFRLEANSPNRGAGSEGTTIGALAD